MRALTRAVSLTLLAGLVAACQSSSPQKRGSSGEATSSSKATATSRGPRQERITIVLGGDVDYARMRGERLLREPNRAEFDKALDRVIALCKDKGLVDRAKQYKAAP